jgi:hypothetical protein
MHVAVLDAKHLGMGWSHIMGGITAGGVHHDQHTAAKSLSTRTYISNVRHASGKDTPAVQH